ncbi:MAG: hypothetical protein RH917_15540 [Lacipirellulaceae bacterium]
MHLKRHLASYFLLSALIALLANSSSRAQPVAEAPPSSAQPAKDSRLMKLVAEGKLTSQILYPMRKGSNWTYDMDVQGKTLEMKCRIASKEKINDQELYKLEAAFNGQVSATEHMSNNKRGLARHRNNGIELTPALQLLRNPVKPGDRWQQEVEHGGTKLKTTCKTSAEVITTPLGKFDVIRVTLNTAVEGINIDADYWFAADVGCVRQVLNLGQTKANVVLRKYELAKEEKPE